MSTPASGHGHRFTPGVIPSLFDTRMEIRPDGSLLVCSTSRDERTITGIMILPSELDNLYHYLQENMEG